MRVLAVIHEPDAGCGVFAQEILGHGHELDEWLAYAQPLAGSLPEYDALIVFGGAMQVDELEQYPWLQAVVDVLGEALERGVPTLGVCLGGQLLARAAGGEVGPAVEPECGWHAIELTDAGLEDPLLGGDLASVEVFQWHSYAFELPPGATPLAHSPGCLQCFRVGERAWGLQWHPEVTGESVLEWAEQYPLAGNGGVPIEFDRAALEATVAARIGATNDEGRALCARFLAAAQRSLDALT